MEAHTHISPVHGIAVLLFIVAVLGTGHLLALGAADNSRLARAWLGLGL